MLIWWESCDDGGQEVHNLTKKQTYVHNGNKPQHNVNAPDH